MTKSITGVFGSRILQRKYDSMHESLCKDRCFYLAARGSFCQDGDVILCNDVDSLFKALELQHNPEEWRLFIDSSKVSLKAVLLHNGNKHPSIPVECSRSGTEKKYYIKKVWPKRQFLIPGVKNEENEPLVASQKILSSPLHIKLGLMKNFVKAMDCGGSGFQYLRLKFPKVSETKIKEGIFVGPQFRQLMKESKLTKKESVAWTSFKELEKSFFGNHKAENQGKSSIACLKADKTM
ncbi:hypothetical protein AVEN_210986-1 [Araneus ventricosus]|uniref:Uncharacterized protein n=1 Tax=Araneus ventricosus TaxID=182803 RepID=A0A4Y2QUY9_ARAVE|nr:hypothetical protein AVEN_210986-1 [Araneus ventricosus]